MVQRAPAQLRGARLLDAIAFIDKGLTPADLVYTEECASVTDAVMRERQLKHWSGEKKAALIAGDRDRLKQQVRDDVRKVYIARKSLKPRTVALPLLAKNEIGLPQCRRRPNACGAECSWTQDVAATRVYLLNHAMVRLHASSAAALL